MKYLVLLILCSSLAVPAFAQRQYRCAGLVQNRPCNDDRAIPALKNQTSTLVASDIRASAKFGPIDPTVISSSYHYDNAKKVGVWRGFVHGDGPIILKLRINPLGKQPELRLMGKAVLRGKVSPFEYRATPPKADRWNWNIFAQNQ